MLKGKTESGFQYEISKERLENYELVEALAELETSPLQLPRVVNLLLGKEQSEALKNHLRDTDGFVSTEKLGQEVMSIFNSKQDLKN